MKKIYCYLGVFVVALVSWVYWSSSTELNKALIFLENSNLINDIHIYPTNSTCLGKCHTYLLNFNS